MKRTPFFFLRTLMAMLVAAFLTACGGGGDAYPDFTDSPGPWRCVDFAYQQDAQAWFNKHPDPPDEDLPEEYDIDPDRDGIACEDLPSRKD